MQGFELAVGIPPTGRQPFELADLGVVDVAESASWAGLENYSRAFGDPVFWKAMGNTLLFAAGMSMMDTTDGVFMSRAYRWAFTSPLRKVYYNLMTTGLSVFVALAVGSIEYLQVASTALKVNNPFFNWLAGLDFETMGYGIVGIFIIVWIGAIILLKYGHHEPAAQPEPAGDDRETSA